MLLFCIESVADTARKTIFSFSRRPEKMVFPKKSRWNMIFLVLLGKMIFLSPENMILPLRRKMKDDLSQKNTRKYDIFFKSSEKMVFWKRAAPEHDFPCIICKDGIFSRKHDIFFMGGKWERPFSRNTWNYGIFCVHVQVLQTCRHAPLPKKSNMVVPAKIHLKVIDILDWHSRKSSSNSLYLHGDFYRRFHVLLSSKKTQKT